MLPWSSFVFYPSTSQRKITVRFTGCVPLLLADPGGRWVRAPFWSNRLAHPSGVGASPSWKSWIRHCLPSNFSRIREGFLLNLVQWPPPAINRLTFFPMFLHFFHLSLSFKFFFVFSYHLLFPQLPCLYLFNIHHIMHSMLFQETQLTNDLSALFSMTIQTQVSDMFSANLELHSSFLHFHQGHSTNISQNIFISWKTPDISIKNVSSSAFWTVQRSSP